MALALPMTALTALVAALLTAFLWTGCGKRRESTIKRATSRQSSVSPGSQLHRHRKELAKETVSQARVQPETGTSAHASEDVVLELRSFKRSEHGANSRARGASSMAMEKGGEKTPPFEEAFAARPRSNRVLSEDEDEAGAHQGVPEQLPEAVTQEVKSTQKTEEVKSIAKSAPALKSQRSKSHHENQQQQHQPPSEANRRKKSSQPRDASKTEGEVNVSGDHPPPPPPATPTHAPILEHTRETPSFPDKSPRVDLVPRSPTPSPRDREGLNTEDAFQRNHAVGKSPPLMRASPRKRVGEGSKRDNAVPIVGHTQDFTATTDPEGEQDQRRQFEVERVRALRATAPKPRKMPRTSWEEQIANGKLQSKKTDYPTMNDVTSDWGSIDTARLEPPPPGAAAPPTQHNKK